MAEKYNADVAFCGVWKGNEDLPVIPKLKTNKIEIYSCQDALEHLLYHDGITGFAPLKVYNKRKFSDIRFNTELSVSEDFVFTWQLLKRCERVAVGNRRLYYYYQNMDSSTHGKITSDKYIHTYKYLEDYIGNTVNSLCKSLCEAYRYRMYISSINTFFKIDNIVFREKLMNYIGCNSFKILKNRRADYKVRVLAFVSYVFSTKIMLGLCELYFSKIEKICIFQRRKPV